MGPAAALEAVDAQHGVEVVGQPGPAKAVQQHGAAREGVERGQVVHGPQVGAVQLRMRGRGRAPTSAAGGRGMRDCAGTRPTFWA